MAHDVFISYSSKDKEAANAVCARLESEGINCWIAPRDIPPSARYAQAIIEGINRSRLMIFIFSSRTTESDHIESEIDRAYNKRIPIIPLRIEDVPLTGSFEYYLSTAQWFDALPPLEKNLERLPGVVRRLLDKDGQIAPAPPPPPRIEPPPAKTGFFRSNVFRVMLGLVLIGITATAAVFWLRPAKKSESRSPGVSTDAANATVSDGDNNLMWTKKTNDGDINWSDATKYCDELALGGFDDWRLAWKLDLKAANDEDIPAEKRIWKSLELSDDCCYWARNEIDAEHALAYNVMGEEVKLAKSNRKDMRALCVRHVGK